MEWSVGMGVLTPKATRLNVRVWKMRTYNSKIDVLTQSKHGGLPL